MEPDVSECAKQLIKEYAQRNSAMGGTSIFQGSQYGRGKTYSTAM